MKKMIVIALVLAAMSADTIVAGDRIEDELKIKVTSEKPTTFDMFDSNRGIIEGLTTPYEIKFKRTDARFIFKTRKARANIKVEVEVNNKTTVTADWPITVVSVTNGSCETFGM